MPNSFLRCLAIFALAMTTSMAGGESVDRVKVSYTQRVRIETTDNATQLDYDSSAGSSYMRNRTSLVLQYRPAPRWEFGVRLTNEFRYYFVPERKQFTLDEIFFDHLYVRRDSVRHLPLTVVVGRQNLNFGEGFVIAEGGPLDGSRSAYFNALNLRWDFSADKSLSLVFAHQPRTDEWLPIIYDQEKVMVEQREQAAIAYYTAKGIRISPQVYLIYKHLGRHSTQPSADIFCLGGRLQAGLTKTLTSTTEAVIQRGKWGDRDQSAVGGYTYLEHKTGWTQYFPQSFSLGALYLSGDDLSTDDHEAWEPMFGRWPKWSESYAYTLTREHGNSYWWNYAAIFVKTSVMMAEDLTISLDYHHLMAPQHTDSLAGFPGGRGRDRGDLFVGKLTYKANAHLSGHVLWESFEPGDYYFRGADHSSWMRTEALLTF